MGTLRRHLLDGALKTIEMTGPAAHLNLHQPIVVVSAIVAFHRWSHSSGQCNRRAHRIWLAWGELRLTVHARQGNRKSPCHEKEKRRPELRLDHFPSPLETMSVPTFDLPCFP